MTVSGRFRRLSVEVVRTVVILAIVLAVGAVYQARGDNHDTTYWACLYAGSLSQVGTTEPANCGRGAKISWVSGGQSGVSQAYAAHDNSLQRLDFAYSVFDTVLPVNLNTVESVEVPAGSYVVSAAVSLLNTVNDVSSASCFVMASTAPSVDLHSVLTLDPSVILASYGALPLAGVVTLDAAGSVEVRCGVFNADGAMIGQQSGVYVVRVSLTAIPVAQVN